MKLKEAVELYKKEKGVSSNSYDWYRKSALSSGKINIGNVNIKTFKKGREWHIDDEDFKKAIISHKAYLEQIKNNTDDHKKGIIHGKDGESITTEWGHYTIYKNFRLEVHTYYSLKDGDTGTWYCNNCNLQAKTEHNKEECHLCRDWNSCGRDCKLSRIFCEKCKKELKF